MSKISFTKNNDDENLRLCNLSDDLIFSVIFIPCVVFRSFMKSIISTGLLTLMLLMPEVGVIGYLAIMGDLNPVSAVGAILAIPGGLVISIII